MHLYLQRSGLSPQKPLARVKIEKASIFCGAETGIPNQDQIDRSWAPKGKIPIVGPDKPSITGK